MKWQVDMKVKDYIRNWSDQEIHTEYKGVTANIDIVNIGLHFILKNVRPYAAPCSEA